LFLNCRLRNRRDLSEHVTAQALSGNVDCRSPIYSTPVVVRELLLGPSWEYISDIVFSDLSADG